MKYIPWWEPKIGNKEHALVAGVLESNFPNEGALTEKFEKKLAALLSVKHVVVVTSATAAMFLSLKALQIGHGDEVIVPDLTFISTANAVEMTGAKAILVDIKPETLSLNPSLFAKMISKKTKAVIPVHVSGHHAEIVEIQKIAAKHNIAVVEDAAEGFLSKYRGKYLGTFGTTGCFSLTPAKTITTGQGGFIATNDTKLFQTLKQLKDQGRPVRGTGGDDIHHSLGFNFKFTDLQAAVGLGQLTYLQNRVKRMKRNYTMYARLLGDLKEVSLLPFDVAGGEIPQWTTGSFERRNELDEYLKKRGIGCRRFWHPLHTQVYYKKSNTNFPVSSNLSPKLLWLPSAFTLNDSDIQRVCKEITSFYADK